MEFQGSEAVYLVIGAINHAVDMESQEYHRSVLLSSL